MTLFSVLLTWAVQADVTTIAPATHTQSVIQEQNAQSTFWSAVQKGIDSIAHQNIALDKINFVEMSGGLTSTKKYSFEVNGKKYVLRSLNTKHDIKVRQDEITVHNIAAELDIAPPLTYVDPEISFMIMPFIEGHTLTQADLQNEAILKKIAVMIQKLHQHKVNFHQNKSQVWRTSKHYQRALSKNVAYPTGFQALFDNFISEGAALEKADPVLTHSDLNRANILVGNDGKIYFIDWTSASTDNRYVDLGYFAFLNGLTDQQTEIFLTAYLNRQPTNAEWQQLKNLEKRTALLTAIVWLEYSESAEEKSIPMDMRVQKLDALLCSPNLKTAQQYIQDNEVVSPLTDAPEAIKLFGLGYLKTVLIWK